MAEPQLRLRMSPSSSSETLAGSGSGNSGKTTPQLQQSQPQFDDPQRAAKMAKKAALEQRTWQYYPAIALAGFVWGITPACWAIVLHTLFKLYRGDIASMRSATAAGWPSGWAILWWHAMVEVPFSIYLFYLSRRVQAPVGEPPAVDLEKMQTLLYQCLDVGLAAHPPKRRGGHADDKFDLHTVTDAEAEALWQRMTRWFHYCPKEQIQRDNVREWLAWAFTGRDLEECRSDQQAMDIIERSLELAENRLKTTFKEGRNPHCKTLRLTLDRVPVLSRPLGYYVVCNGVTALTVWWAQRYGGFQFVREGDCEFLVLPAAEKPRQRAAEHAHKAEPILFLHGLGIGLGQYFAFLRHLRMHDCGVVVLIQANISATIWHRHFLSPPPKDAQVDAIRGVLKRFGFKKATILSHSNGTMVHGWVARGAPEICGRHVIVDPVSFRLWEGKTCYAFLARQWVTGVEVLLGYFVARELSIATTICRQFNWSDMALWAHDLPSHTPEDLQLVFGEHDMLIDVPASVEYLKDAGVPDTCITVVPKYQHGKSLFFDAEGMDIVLRACDIPRYSKEVTARKA